MKTISIHDHRLIYYHTVKDKDETFTQCYCGEEFEYIDDFNDHQKEMLNKQLKEQDIELEVV